jgi:hypothetical protein
MSTTSTRRSAAIWTASSPSAAWPDHGDAGRAAQDVDQREPDQGVVVDDQGADHADPRAEVPVTGMLALTCQPLDPDGPCSR